MDKKHKRIMILSGSYIVLMVVLLIGVSTAKYTNSVVAYASSGAASFNVVILDAAESYVASQLTDTMPDLLKDPEGSDHWMLADAHGNSIGRTVIGSELYPGITRNDSENYYDFYVANGDDPSNISDIAFTYNIRLRTTRNIPLRYVLADEAGNYYESGTPALLSADDSGMTWYEWTFKIPNGTDQPLFYLAGGTFDHSMYRIFMEWPIVDKTTGNTDAAITSNIDRTNSTDYMKEVELLEVRVIAASVNNATEPATEDNTNPAMNGEYYASGYVLLEQGARDGQYLTTYPLDFRSFEAITAGIRPDRQYKFTVQNGAAVGEEQLHKTSDFSVRLKVPYSEGLDECEFTLYEYDKNGNRTELTGEIVEYRIYDKKDDPIAPVTKNMMTEEDGYEVVLEPGQAQISNEEKLYAVYGFRAEGMLDEPIYHFENTGSDKAGDYVIMNSKGFALKISGAGDSGLPGNGQAETKLQLLITNSLGD